MFPTLAYWCILFKKSWTTENKSNQTLSDPLPHLHKNCKAFKTQLGMLNYNPDQFHFDFELTTSKYELWLCAHFNVTEVGIQNFKATRNFLWLTILNKPPSTEALCFVSVSKVASWSTLKVL